MYQWSFQHKTPSSLITIHAKSIVVPAKDLLSYENKHVFDRLCRIGCVNFNKKWSCPPYSPSYSKLSDGYSNLLLILLYSYLDQFDYIQNKYTKVRAGNVILKSLAERSLRHLEKIFDGIMISNGSCRLCRPCTLKLGKTECKRPEKMRYSMESLGLNVIKISTDYFDHKLLWYRKKEVPLYTSVVSGLLTNSDIDLDLIETRYLISTAQSFRK